MILTSFAIWSFISLKHHSRLLSEVEDVLGDRKEVTGDDLDKMKYTEQVLGHAKTMILHIDMCFISKVIKEALRMYPPGVATVKQSPKGGIELRDHHIPEGTDISVSSALHLVHVHVHVL